MRIGMGISTNEKMLKFASIGGFAGYGIKDRQMKYGGFLVFDIDRHNEVQLRLSYQNNLKEPGLDFHDNSLLVSSSDYLRGYNAYRMDNFIEEKAEFSFRMLRYMKFSAALSIKEIKPTYEYQYKWSPLTGFCNDEFQISARYAYGEELTTIGNQKMVFYQGNPIINLTYKRGVDPFKRGSYTYNRAEASIDIIAYKGRLGQSSLRIAGGRVDSSLPYSLLFTGEGSKNGYVLTVVNNYFQTMNLYEFLSDRYLNLFYSHNFGTLLFETPKFKPQFVIAHNTGWGALKNASYQGIEFKIKDKVYLESGLIINNIIRLKYLRTYYIGFGGGAFYRYGYYSLEKTIDNFAFKLSLTISLN
jgi:hypothetical protein